MADLEGKVAEMKSKVEVMEEAVNKESKGKEASVSLVH